MIAEELKKHAEILMRAGVLSNREIGRRLNINEKTLRVWAKAGDWKPDLRQAVKERLDEKLVQSAESNIHKLSAGTANPLREVDQDQLLDELAQEQFEIIKKHKKIATDMIATTSRILEHVKKKLDTADETGSILDADDSFILAKTQHQLSSAQLKMATLDRTSHNLEDFNTQKQAILVEINI